ncbi:MAG: formylmethanofuran dehydrogenase subunit E family protein [Desulfobacteraceae bacterium]|nr:formylmethanofuran dehydrogenase subunit E family protein [Desulfobacteraceae bacterium]
MICGRTPEELIRDIKAFHGYVAPGLLIGAFMVDSVQLRLGKGVEADAIVETKHCLPDAVQLFSPCTVGNGWLKILDLDKFALTFHDRHSHSGIRVWLDIEKAKAFPDIYNWFMRLVSKKDLPTDVLVKAIFSAGTDILSHAEVKVIQFAAREKKGAIKVCSICHEAYAASQGETCLACQGNGYYQRIPA